MARGAGRKDAKPGTFGTVHKLPSGRYRALYTGPDGRRHKAPTTFTAIIDARAWLAVQQAEIIRNAWTPPEAEPVKLVTFRTFAEDWLAGRDLKQRTREHYRSLLDKRLLPTFGELSIATISPDDVSRWHRTQGTGTPTMTAHAYSLLATICSDAIKARVASQNPCVLRGAGYAKRVKRIKPATLDQLAVIVDNMPDRYRLMVVLAGWCALRFGELTALTRADVVIEVGDDGEPVTGTLTVSKGVVRADGERQVTTPKSEAGDRNVAIPPHLLPGLKTHLKHHVESAKTGLLFPAIGGGFLAPATFYRHFYKARESAGRSDLRFHDLRHTGAVLAAATGATLAELMNRLGHATPGAALRYQHVTDGADRRLADLLSELANGS